MADGRYAPSPTGRLHVGNLRTAVVAWLLARSSAGRFVLRFDDLDEHRVSAAPGAMDSQRDDLASLGLDWDLEVRQSERLPLYADALASLPTFPCFCTRREIAAAVSAPHGGVARYPGTCRAMTRAQRDQLASERPAALRLDAGDAIGIAHDRWRGKREEPLDDVVLRRNDGAFAYHLVTVVDDGMLGIEEVCRADDLWPTSPTQAWLAGTLGYPVPTFAHVGLVTNADGERLAKRDGAVTLDDMRALGGDERRVLAWIGASLGLCRDDEAIDLADLLARHRPEPVAPIAFTGLPGPERTAGR